MRQLLPTRLYPGRSRVGADLTQLATRPGVRLFDGIDWYWLPSMLRACLFLGCRRPDVVILQWWSGHGPPFLPRAVDAGAAPRRACRHRIPRGPGHGRGPHPAGASLRGDGRRRGDPARGRVRGAFRVRPGTRCRRTGTSGGDRWPSSRTDRTTTTGRPRRKVRRWRRSGRLTAVGPCAPALRDAPEDACNLLFFGVIRPYKGLEDLVEAFERIPEHEVVRLLAHRRRRDVGRASRCRPSASRRAATATGSPSSTDMSAMPNWTATSAAPTRSSCRTIARRCQGHSTSPWATACRS